MWKTEVLVKRDAGTRDGVVTVWPTQLLVTAGSLLPPTLPATQGEAGVRCRPGSSTSDLSGFATKAEKGSHRGEVLAGGRVKGLRVPGSEGRLCFPNAALRRSLRPHPGQRLARVPGGGGGSSSCQSSRGPTKRQLPRTRVWERGGGLAFGERVSRGRRGGAHA